jgi:hypothetical protein
MPTMPYVPYAWCQHLWTHGRPTIHRNWPTCRRQSLQPCKVEQQQQQQQRGGGGNEEDTRCIVTVRRVKYCCKAILRSIVLVPWPMRVVSISLSMEGGADFLFWPSVVHLFLFISSSSSARCCCCWSLLLLPVVAVVIAPHSRWPPKMYRLFVVVDVPTHYSCLLDIDRYCMFAVMPLALCL